MEGMFYPSRPQWPRPGIVVIGIIAASIAAWIAWTVLAGAPQADAVAGQFVVPLGTTQAAVADKLAAEGFVKHAQVFARLSALRGSVQPGGYTIAKDMNAWQVAGALAQQPSAAWVIIPEGLRKEEIADLLARSLGWTDAKKSEWLTVDTVSPSDYREGVYFPDTYLIPLTESPADVAKRLQNHFEEVFAPYASEALRQNIRWPTLVKIASIVQREAAGSSDMPLIAGIIWNRLLGSMRLEIDSTLQYARGNTGNGWWAPLTAADKKIDSPYNTYLHAGLPPTPISNPGLDAIKAVLHPAKTDCLYYLHDASRQIHCSATYASHLQNISTYLRQ
ncbi:MAG: endolytic transglycosylase MltG [Patescibacteria group bacterium]|nr:endolytic transglycosylase MltG [Patescibacteria group bacterium]